MGAAASIPLNKDDILRKEIDEFVSKLKEENLSDGDIEKKVKEKYMPKIYEQYMNRNRVYVRSLDGLDVELSVIEAGICKDAKKLVHYTAKMVYKPFLFCKKN